MARRAASEPLPDDSPSLPVDQPDPTAPAAPIPLDGLGVVGVTRRRVAWLIAAIVAVWVVIVFARQVGEASAASARAAAVASDNARLTAGVTALQKELDTIQEQAFVLQQARADGLGTPNERPFRLQPGASPLPADAPGSDEQRLGTLDRHETPLESWLSLLFGDDAAS